MPLLAGPGRAGAVDGGGRVRVRRDAEEAAQHRPYTARLGGSAAPRPTLASPGLGGGGRVHGGALRRLQRCGDEPGRVTVAAHAWMDGVEV